MIYFIILFSFLLARIDCNLSLSGTLTTGNSYIQFPYTTTSSSTYLILNLVITPSTSAVLGVLQSTNVPPSTNRLDWLHINPRSTTRFDYQGLVTGRSQQAWMLHPGSGSTVYVFLINLEQGATPSYSFLLKESGTPNSCVIPLYYGSTTYCQSCASSATGIFCNIGNHQMQVGNTISTLINANSYSLFTLQNQQSQVSFSVAGPSGINLYIQLDNDFQQCSGIVNFLSNGNVPGYYYFNSYQQYQVDLTQTYKSIAVGIINTNSFPLTITVKYIKPSESNNNILVILIAVMGTLLAIGIVITIIILVRRNRNSQRGNPNIRAVIPEIIPLKLSAREIDYFFPTAIRNDVFPGQINKQSSQEWHNLPDFQCIICLCPIEPQETIKVGYCKHLFHANCLIQWFQKQQNCPYCRQDYSRKSTIELYRDLKKESSQQLKGKDIIWALFRPKLNATLQTLHIQDIEGCNQ